MKVLVTGGRKYSDRETVYRELANASPELVIHGGCSGADRLAGEWCAKTGTPSAVYEAPWDALGYPAGPKRNSWMLKYSAPDLVLAFPGGKGTADMTRKARSAGVEVRVVEPGGTPND